MHLLDFFVRGELPNRDKLLRSLFTLFFEANRSCLLGLLGHDFGCYLSLSCHRYLSGLTILPNVAEQGHRARLFSRKLLSALFMLELLFGFFLLQSECFSLFFCLEPSLFGFF